MSCAADSHDAHDARGRRRAEIDIVLTHRSGEDPDSVLRVECAISESFQVGAIDLPPPDTTISLAGKIEQERDRVDA